MKVSAHRIRPTETPQAVIALAALLVCCGLASCSKAPSEPAPAAKEASAPAAPAAPSAGQFAPVATVQDIMLSMVDPKADNIWNSVATIVTLEGTEERRPRTDEDWTNLHHDAITLVEATNLLLMERQVAKPGVKSENPGIELEPDQIAERIAQDRSTWNQHVRDLHDQGMVMLKAIEAHDVDTLFDQGGNLDAVCEGCHRQYWYPDPQHHAPPPSEAEKALQKQNSADAGTDPAPPTTGTIEGHVRLAGKLPGNAVIRMGMDPKCADINRGRQVVQEEFALEKDGSLGNVFVKLAGEFPATPVPADVVLLDQTDCLFAPRVVGARVGQTLRFENSDPLLHNVHGISATTNNWNVAQPVQGMKSDVELAAEDGMLQIKCDVHRWMNAWIGVVDHPYFAVSDRTGSFTIHDVPAGQHTVVAWHEKLGSLEQKVGVTPGGTAEVELTYGEAKL